MIVRLDSSKNSNKDAGEIFRLLSSKFNGKGNGKKEFASGMSGTEPEIIIKTIKELII